MVKRKVSKRKAVKGKGKLPRTVVVSKRQTGTSVRKVDKARTAMPPGRRLSASGKKYTENRRNRSDKNPKTRL